MTVVNNCKYDCENIIILGKIPFEGNKDIISSSDLGSTFTTKMISKINNESGIPEDKISIYYSTNEEATKELNNVSNRWTQDVTDITKQKSFMIVISNYTINIGDSLCFSYNIQIPEDLQYNQTTYATFGVYYNQSGKSTQEYARGALVGITTGEKPEPSDKIEMKIHTMHENEITAGVVESYTLCLWKNVPEDLKNATITFDIPEGLTFVSAERDGVYNDTTKRVTWKVERVKDFVDFQYSDEAEILEIPEELDEFLVNCRIDKLKDGEYKKEIPVTFNVTYDGSEKTYSKTTSTTVVAEGFTLSQTSNITNANLSTEEEITYVITVKNLSVINTSAVITDILPKELEFIEFYYTQDGKTTRQTVNIGNAVDIYVTMSPNEVLNIYLRAKTNKVTTSAKITNEVFLNSGEIKNLKAESITHTLVEEATNRDEIKHKISGFAWIDEDKNGRKDESESIISGLKVYLLDSISNNVIAETLTDKNGVYRFDNIELGDYIVAFEYDNMNYDLTTYQAKGVNGNENSDVINMTLTIGGKTNKYAVSDTIKLNLDVYNVDIGLIVSPKFDLEFTKGVSLIQVSNTKGTQTYTFDNSPIAKVEIPEKEINGSAVAVTYTLTIKNTGTVPGYVKKIVDYMPRDMSFSSNLNPEWYQDIDGNLYNTSLSNTLINPGEKIEITLVLTETMTDDNVGLVTNSAEIYDTSNNLGIADIDSIPGNKGTNEDDYSIADAIITIKTGAPAMFIWISLAVLMIFTVGIVIIKKKVIQNI